MTRPVDGNLEEMNRYADVLERENTELKWKLEWLEEQFRLNKHRRFGPSSERTHPDQAGFLFDEAETTSQPAEPEPSVETVTYQRRKKAKGQREEVLEGLHTETITYELPEADQACEQCDGPLHVMSKQVRREIKYTPAKWEVVAHEQLVYGCRHCEHKALETPIVTAPMPAPPIPGSLVSPSLLAHIMHQKYCLSLPLYRQEQELHREGIKFSRVTLSNWLLAGSKRWLEPLYRRMHHHLLEQEILHADETHVQVLHEPGRKPETKSYMWLYRSGRDGPGIVLFDYQMTRHGEHPRAFLAGFSGFLHVDGYEGYKEVSGAVLVACWAHARRKFDEALKALPPKARSSKTPPAAVVALEFFRKLFKIEERLKGVSPEWRKAERERLSKPLVDEFEKWLLQQNTELLPKSASGKAVSYCLKLWKKLVRFLEDGRLEIDNNRAERSIKPFVIGRKNWMFANTQNGARASAVIYSVVESAKENKLNPFRYLTYLFERLPNMDLDDEAALDALMPWSTTLPEDCRVSR